MCAYSSDSSVDAEVYRPRYPCRCSRLLRQRARECRGSIGGGWSGGSCTPAAAAAAPRKAPLDAGIIVHLAQKKVVGGIAPEHLLFGIRAWTEGRIFFSIVQLAFLPLRLFTSFMPMKSN
jgi:hypothetical protein